MNYYFRKLIQFFRPPANNNFQVPASLVPYVTPFGSRIWGGYSSKSDVDLLARREDDGHLTHLLKQLGIDYKITRGYWHDTKKITFSYSSFRFEISCCDDSSYPSNLQTILLCTSYFQEHPFSSSEKAYRIYVFNHFQNFFKRHHKLPISLHNHLVDHYPELLI